MHNTRLARLGSWLGLLMGASSCSRPLPEANYQAYLREPSHGLVQQTTAGELQIEAAIRPTELVVHQELGGAEATPALVDSLRRVYAGKTYCTLSFASNGQDLESYTANQGGDLAQLVSYLNTGIGAVTYLVPTAQPQDSVPAVLAQYTRGFGTSNQSTVLLVFDTTRLPIQEGFTLALHDPYLGVGSVRFHFKGSDLNALPALLY